ncbi:hypothetical protein [Aeromonas hydrophila]|uniref:hypothetical protein n=1 Tax=Aeromonas hydrophila TaxID=644 RepID=UPI001FC8091C|nr:hypothetical protein [Aeromonas hydrophila]GKQ99850.1 hypothetical protein KAM461_41000 [Aeromonas hydrophila]
MKGKYIYFVFLVLLLISVVFFFNKKEIVVDGKVGEYVKASILKEGDGMPFTDLGYGLFYKNGTVFGWPDRAGNYKVNNGKFDITISIKPLVTEVVGDKHSGVKIEWNAPDKNHISLYHKNNHSENISSDIPGIKWQLGASRDLNYIYWVNFEPNGSGDRVVVMDRGRKNRVIIGSDSSIHRKPMVNGEYIYWYQDDISSKDRKIKIMRMRLTINAAEEEVLSSVYPNTITDYTVLPKGVVAIVKKNYDQQRSEIDFIENGNVVSTFYEDDSFIQNILTENHGVLFEIKRHRENFCTAVINDNYEKTDVTCISGKDVFLSNNGVNLFKKTPGDSVITYKTLLGRYSPPITGFSIYNNDYAMLSITESPVILSLVNMYKKTSDISYLYLAAERATHIINSNDRSVSHNNMKSGWDVKVFSNNNKATSFLVHDAIILDSLLVLAKEFSSSQELSKRYPNYLDDLKKVFINNYDHHHKQFYNYNSDVLGIIKKGEAYYTFPDGDGYKYDRVNLPFNMMNAYIRPLINYAMLSHDDKYLEIATSLGKLFKRHLQYEEKSNSYLWPYWWGMYTDGWSKGQLSKNTPSQKKSSSPDYVDIDHASLDIRAVLALKENNLVFNNDDLQRFLNRMLILVKDEDYKIPLLIDGSIKSANYNSIEYLWGQLSELRPDVQCEFLKVAGGFPYVQDAYTPTARFELLGYSYLIDVVDSYKCNINGY